MKRIPVISLLTDFGLQDEYVGVMKGVILSINPRAQLVDISHHIARHDIVQAALVIKSAFKYFPKGTIHVIVVDPGVGGKRRIICLRQNGHFFIAPDNGVLTLVIQDGGMEEIYHVNNEACFLKPVSNTFHGRDVFAPVAAYLSKGVDILRLGEKITLSDINLLDVPTPFFSPDDQLIGKIISVDHFGNLITSISREDLDRFLSGLEFGRVGIWLGKFKIKGVSKAYDTVKAGSPVAIIGSRNLLEISINQADASVYFRATVGDAVKVRLEKKKRYV